MIKCWIKKKPKCFLRIAQKVSEVVLLKKYLQQFYLKSIVFQNGRKGHFYEKISHHELSKNALSGHTLGTIHNLGSLFDQLKSVLKTVSRQRLNKVLVILNQVRSTKCGRLWTNLP